MINEINVKDFFNFNLRQITLLNLCLVLKKGCLYKTASLHTEIYFL